MPIASKMKSTKETNLAIHVRHRHLHTRCLLIAGDHRFQPLVARKRLQFAAISLQDAQRAIDPGSSIEWRLDLLQWLIGIAEPVEPDAHPVHQR